MNARPHVFRMSGNPVVQVLYGVVFAVLLVGAVVMGAVLLAAVVGVAVLAWIVFSIRLWWLRRKLGRAGAAAFGDRGAAQGRTNPGEPAGRLIDAEYTVVDERDPQRGPRDGTR
jgi:hypothetical protein